MDETPLQQEEAFELKAPDRTSLESLEAFVVEAPAEDDARRRYIESAKSLGLPLRAAASLRGLLAAAQRPDVRERVGLDLASLYFGEGELPQARAALLDVVRGGTGGPAALAAARRLLDLQAD